MGGKRCRSIFCKVLLSTKAEYVEWRPTAYSKGQYLRFLLVLMHSVIRDVDQ